MSKVYHIEVESDEEAMKLADEIHAQCHVSLSFGNGNAVVVVTVPDESEIAQFTSLPAVLAATTTVTQDVREVPVLEPESTDDER